MIETLKNVATNVVTFGASGRVKSAQDSYEKAYRKYNKKKTECEAKASEIKTLFENLIKVKMKVQDSVKKLQNIVPTEVKDRDNTAENNGKINLEQLSYVHNSLESGDIIINSIKGTGVALSVGAAAAPAALWIVGNFGVASTGVAISALSGAAATNATLAALGGGAIAAGGGGMAAGASVLATLGPVVGVAVGAVALPLFSHLSANKKIKEIEEKECEIWEAIDEIESQMLEFEVYEKRTNELIDSLNKGIEAFDFVYKKIKKELFPLGFISKLYRRCKFIVLKRKNQIYYSQQEYEKINLLVKNAKDLLVLRDTPIVDKN